MALRQKIFESNNKGLFDVAVGEGNISPNYATELQNSRVALNGEVSKRRGRVFFNDVAIHHAAGNSVDTYASSNQSGTVSMYSANNEDVGFAVTLSSDESIQSVKFWLKKSGSPTGLMRAKIYASTGTVGSTGVPTGDILKTSLELDSADLTTSFAFVEFTFETPHAVSAGDVCFVLDYRGGNASNYIILGTDSSSPTHGSNAFKSNTADSGWVQDAQDIIFDLFRAGPDVIGLMVYDGNYPSTYEVLAQADTRLLRYTASTGAFDTVVKSGLTLNKKLNWTMFNNKMILSNGTDNPFKYGYTPKPFAPTTGTSASGIKAVRTYYVTVTYVTAYGESVASQEATQAIGISYVPIPAIPTTGVTTDGSKLSRTYYVSTTYITGNGESTPTAFGAAGTAVLTGDAVTSVTPTASGDSYSTAPTVTFSGGGGSSAAGTAVLTGGQVTSITIGSGGSGYTSAPTVAFSGGEKTQAIGGNDVLTVTSPSASTGATHYNVYHHTVSGALKLQNVSPIVIGTDYTETTGSLNDGALPPTSHTGSYGYALTVTSPVTLPGATHYNVYHHTVSGSLKLQTSTPLAIGVNYTEAVSLNDGAAPPTAHTGWYAVDLADNPPKGKYVYALNNRVWVSGVAEESTRFSGSAVDNEDDWSTPSDYVNIDLSAVLARGDTITGLARLGQTSSLIIGLQNHIVTYSVPATFNDIAIDKQIFNTGVMSHRGMDEVGLDNYIVEREGLNSVKMELIVQGLKTRKLSDNIRDRINPLLKSIADPDEVNVVNHKAENEFWINVPSLSKRFVYDYEIKAWMEDRGVKIFQSVRTPDNDILSAGVNGRVSREYETASGGNVYGDGNNNTSVSWEWETPWLWFDNISIKKLFKYFQFKGSGSGGLFNLDVFFDFETQSYKTFYLQSTPAKWGTSDWDGSYWDFPDVNKVLIPMIGMGRSIRFKFSANHKADLSISFYGVKYANAGFRAND